MNRTNLVIKLFNPNNLGISRWVSKEECTGKFKSLYPTNGNQWYRNIGLSHYIFEKNIIDGIIHWRFNGFKEKQSGRPIKDSIRKNILNRNCSHTGFSGSKNNEIIVDHKNGRYDDEKVLNVNDQILDDFQPLNNQSNLKKRTDCMNCIKTNNRFDGKTLGYSISVIEGELTYDGYCNGCYWYDCEKFKKELTKILVN
jgi:hypothetical protein